MGRLFATHGNERVWDDLIGPWDADVMHRKRAYHVGIPHSNAIYQTDIALMEGSVNSCTIREPYPATKERLVQRNRQMAKNSSEISTSESNVKEIYYSTPSVDFNPSAPSFSPKRVQSPQNMEKEPEVTSQLPASTRLNPDSKPFVPSVPRPTSGLNVEAAPFVPSFAVPQQAELLPYDVSESLSKMKIVS